MNNAEHVAYIATVVFGFFPIFFFFGRQISYYAPRSLPVFTCFKQNQLGTKMLREEVTQE